MCQFMYPGTDIMGERYCISQCNTDLRKPEGQMERLQKERFDGGPIEGSSMRRPGGEDPPRLKLNFSLFSDWTISWL